MYLNMRGVLLLKESQAKRALAEAHEAGDYEKVADAQSAIAQIAIEKERLRLQKARSEQNEQADYLHNNKHSNKHNHSHNRKEILS